MNNNQAPVIQPQRRGRQKLAQCHICMNIVTQYAECSGNRCKNAYCFNCIVEKFNKKNFTPKDYVKGCWVCFQCGGTCKCLLCTGIDTNRRKKNPKKQTVEQPSNTCTVSKYDEQKEQQEKNQPKDAEDKSKTRYDTRRLPKRKNTVFKYKKRRRTRNKNVNDLKDMIKNLKPEDKVLKIKKQDIISDSSVSNFDESSELELISFSKQNQPSNSQQKDASQKSSEQKMQIQKDQIKKQPDHHEKESRILEYSSSLDYLGKEDDIFQVKAAERKTKTIKKPQRKRQEIPLKKLSTIKSADSKKQISKSIQQIQVVGRTRRSQQIKRQVQTVPNAQQTAKRRIRRTPPFQADQQNNLANKNQQQLKRTHLTRRSIKIQQSKVQIKINEHPSTRQSRQLRKLFGSAYVRPSKRKPQQAQSQNEEVPIDQESRKISNANEQIEESQKLESQNSGQGQGDVDDENNIFEGYDQRRDDREFVKDNHQDSNQSPKKSKAMLMKQHYQEELLKNKDFQRNDQSSVSNEMEQENAEEELNQKSQNITPEELNRANSQNNENKTNENVSDKNDKASKNEEINKVHDEKTITQNLRPKRNKDIRKSVQQDGVYKKGHHRKLHNPKPQQGQNAKKIDTNITNKWSKIPDQHLLDKRFFDRLCHQALFARQIFKKEISELIRRRQLIIQKKKLQSMAVVQQPLNNEINLC